MKKSWRVLLVACGMLFSLAGLVSAAGEKPVEMSADTIEYDATRGVMVATGNVKITQEKSFLTGAQAEYNTKTQETYIHGGVKVVKEEATLTADEVRGYENNHLIASGQPVLTKGQDRLSGPKIDYYADRGYALVEGWAKMDTADGTITGNRLEAFTNEERVVVDGNVHIVSETRKLDAVSDHAVYYGKKGEGKTVLTGNARAIQDGNTLTGNTLTIYLDEKSMDAQGRSKLVVTPKEQ